MTRALFAGASAVALLAAATTAHAQLAIDPVARGMATNIGSPTAATPGALQGNVNISSPFNKPYFVVPNPGAATNVQTQAVRLRNRQMLNQWWQDIGNTTPGAIQVLGDQTIEWCGQPSDITLSNQSVGSIDFRNTSAKAGSLLLATKYGVKLVAYDCRNAAYPVQFGQVLIGGRGQNLTLEATSGVSYTADPVASHVTATFASGVMTVTAPLNNAGGAVAANANGSIKAGQSVVFAPGTGSTIPPGCYVVSQASGNTSLDGTYNVDGGPIASPHACQTYTNAVGQTVYLGQAGEVANNGYHGNTGFYIFCSTQSTYDIYATNVQTGRALPPVNAGTYGSCGSGNNSFSNIWQNVRVDTFGYRGEDMQGWNAGSSGDTFGSIYIANGGRDANVIGIENKYYSTGLIRNGESTNLAKVESADYLNPNTANNGGQTNISPIAAYYIVGGNTQSRNGMFHLESNTYNCTGGFGSDNAAFIFQGSGSSLDNGNIEMLSTTLVGCTHFNGRRWFGTDVHGHDGVIHDGGTSGGSGSWVLNGATVSLLTSNNSSLTRAAYQVDQLQLENSPGGITAASYNLATADAPVLRFTSLPTVNIYSTAGSYTWSNPTLGGLQGNTHASVLICGGGGGGGGGADQASGSAASGGAGGGGASCDFKLFSTSELGASQSIVIAAGGAGGAAQATATTAGNNGATGNNSTFGTLMKAWGGGLGAGGQLAGSSGGGGGGGCANGGNASGSTAGVSNCGGSSGGSGANGSSASNPFSGSGGGGGSVAAAFTGGAAMYNPGGSSGGALLAASSTAGGAGVSPMGLAFGGAAGASSGGAGGNGSQITASNPGGSGGGGGGNFGGAGGAAGTSANGAGGSGGGSGTTGGGQGATGGAGLGVVRTW